ncbi:hypothetical protein CEXT_774541 [Caerostris extrusa]|uniref:Uncharacterized protein n=1 Tax=Caerostris extrusa TaxID=172846 RepID=A0AAV4UC00_CAEEX|nr:hypothetical protein CEXT_774541 [Caerostris extrusa]
MANYKSLEVNLQAWTGILKSLIQKIILNFQKFPSNFKKSYPIDYFNIVGTDNEHIKASELNLSGINRVPLRQGHVKGYRFFIFRMSFDRDYALRKHEDDTMKL